MAKNIEIFRAGTHTSSNGKVATITRDDLARCVAAYDPTLSEAPLVVGHPVMDAPAYGWVERLALSGDVLTVEPTNVDAAFANIVNAGRYKKISACFFTPNATDNPKPGTYYLRHVGFLGAAAPAVKGLRSVSFAGGEDGFLTFADGDLSFAQREAAMAHRERAATRKENASFLEGLIKEAKVRPAHRDMLLQFMERLDNDAVVSFADPGAPAGMAVEAPDDDPDDGLTLARGMLDLFKDFLGTLAPLVMLGVHPAFKDAGAGDGDLPSSAFAAPPGYRVDPRSAELHAQAVAYAREKGVSYSTAVLALSPAKR